MSHSRQLAETEAFINNKMSERRKKRQPESIRWIQIPLNWGTWELVLRAANDEWHEKQ